MRRAKREGSERKVWKSECRFGETEMPDCILLSVDLLAFDGWGEAPAGNDIAEIG